MGKAKKEVEAVATVEAVVAKVDKMDEQILVIERAVLFNDEQGVFQGYRGVDEASPEIAASFETVQVKRRGDMEEDPTFKQLIPYTAVIDRETGDWLVYERLSQGGEKRLEGKQSIGVGGHANAIDGETTAEAIIAGNALRELNEELILKEDVKITRVGYVNDDANEVGKVHFGVINVAFVSSKDVVECGEPDILAIGWSTWADLKENDRLEEWSKIVVNSVTDLA